MDPLATLLSPYRRAIAGQEPDYETDPLYALLASAPPPQPADSAVHGPAVPGGDIQQLAARLAAKRYGWTGDQWAALQEIVSRESGWNNEAQNPSSTAYGLFQFLNGTWAGTGFEKTSDPRQQILAGLKYVANRYSDPVNALQFHNENGWY